jgi:molecular chaperone DnaK (HSP70)
MSKTILGIDLGKFKSVACVSRGGPEPSFDTQLSTPRRC